MEDKLKNYYLRLGVAIEITVWVFVFYFISSNAKFEDLVVHNVLMMMVSIVLFHFLAYDIYLIVKIVIEKKVLKINAVKPEIQQSKEICPNCGSKITDKTRAFCSKCGAPLK